MPAARSTKKTAAKKPAARKPATAGGADGRGDAAAVRAYFAQQPADKRALLEKLRGLVLKGVPEATPSIKWGVAVYQRNGRNVCALAAFKDHVGINFFASPQVLVDPGKKLEGGGTGSRMLKVRRAEDIDAPTVLRWLKAAVAANS